MSNDPSEAIGRAIAMLLMIGLAVTYFAWGSIVRLGADGTEGDIALWLYDDDAVRGGTIDARVRIDSGDRVRINSVVVGGAGAPQRFGGAGQDWGNTIQVKQGGVPSDATAAMDLTIALPAEGDSVHLVISVSTTAAVGFGNRFFNDHRKAVFERDVELHASATGRRAVRVAIALGAAAAVVVLLIAVRRRYLRRGLTPHATWLVLLLPHALLGYHVFWRQLAAGTHIHGVAFGIACMVAWFAILAIPGLVTGPLGLRRYRVAPAVIATPAHTDDAYRSADPPRREVPTVSLEGEWISAGLVVTRRRGWLSVARPGARPARVRVPRSETFGGEPFEIYAPDRGTVEAMVVAAARLLGELRCHSEGEPELRIEPPR